MDYWKVIFGMLVAVPIFAGEPVITVEPRELRGVPGEPLRLELTVEADRATPIRLSVPAVSNLVLRTIEKVPVQRAEKGRFVQKRIIFWQGIEAGSVTLTNLTVGFQGLENRSEKVPSIGIIVDAVEPAQPPAIVKGEAK